jgi:hypothetical protein
MSGVLPERGVSRHELWYGRAERPIERQELRAGGLTVELEETEVRAVRAGDAEVLCGLYMAVRDEHWGTVPGHASNLVINRGDDEFTVEFDMTHRDPSVAFSWRGKLDGHHSGTISYELAGVAAKAFKYCRIGFCLLHPPSECAGQPYRGRSPKGAVTGTLPVLIGPQQFDQGVYWPLFPSVSELELTLASGLALKLLFEGDLFEMEDQRNWTDASFKTYCTPQELGYPFDAHEEQQFWQRVTLEVAGTRTGRGRVPGAPQPHRSGDHQVSLDVQRSQPLPPLGLSLPREVNEHSGDENALLARAGPRHVRVDMDLSSEGWVERARAAGRVASSLGCQLELAVSAQEPGQLDELVSEIAALPVARLLVFTLGAETSAPSMTAGARKLCTERGLEVAVFGGTDLWFAEVNRDRPDMRAMDGLVYSITPQVHTFDETSIAQSLEAQPETVKTATTFAAGLPVIVSPVTLRPRDPIEVDPPDLQSAATDTVPFSVDPRQASLFTAAWTLGSIAALAGAGAASITYYETVGARGIIPGDRPLPPREVFVSPGEGGAFAVFHVFADALELGEKAMLVSCRSSSPAEVAAMALAATDALVIWVANLTTAPVSVTVGPLADQAVSLRMLDETTANEALAEPKTYRSRPGSQLSLRAGEASIDLTPFAIARLDILSGGRP